MLETDSVKEILNVLEDSKIGGGNFTIRFDGDRFAARFLTWLYPNLRKINLIYGDSAIFVRCEFYERIGGFQPFPIFENLDLVQRLKSFGEMVNLRSIVTTSSRRFENKSFFLTFARWSILQFFYWLGTSPDSLGKFYYPQRRRKNKTK